MVVSVHIERPSKHESLIRFYQEYVQSALGLVAMDDWVAIDQFSIRFLLAKNRGLSGVDHRADGRDDHDGPARQAGICSTCRHRSFRLDPYAVLAMFQAG